MSSIWSWGANRHSQLGTRYEEDEIGDPVYLPFPEKVKEVCCGSLHSSLLTEDGRLFTWGSGQSGRLGHGVSGVVRFPKHVIAIRERILQVSCGASHMAVVCEGGKAYTWGSGWYGKLGTGTESTCKTPYPHTNRYYTQVCCGDGHTLFLTKEKYIFTCGYNDCGQTGFPSQTLSVNKLNFSFYGIEPVKLFCGRSNSAVLCKDGSLYIWGCNEYGQLGDRTTTNNYIPQKVNVPGPVLDFSVGGDHCACIVGKSLENQYGELYMWGRGDLGHQGTILRSELTTPRIVDSFKNINLKSISCGLNHTTGITDNGDLWCWGWNKYFQCSKNHIQFHLSSLNDNQLEYTQPILLKNIGSIESVSCGQTHTAVIIKGPVNVMFQHIRDGNYEEFIKISEGSNEHKKQLFSENYKSFTPLLCAISYDRLNICQYILSSYPESIFMNTNGGQSGLHIASQYGRLEIAKLLISKGISVSQIDFNYETALHIALKSSESNPTSFDVAHLLAQHGADLECLNEDLESPLDLCSPQDAFKLKKAAGYLDVQILFEKNEENFAKKVKSNLESFYLSTDLMYSWTIVQSLSDPSVQKQIFKAKVILFIISQASISSKPCLTILQMTSGVSQPKSSMSSGVEERNSGGILKIRGSPMGNLKPKQEKSTNETKVKICSIWKNRVELPPELELLIFRHQVLDFSQSSSFGNDDKRIWDSLVSQLVSGIWNLLKKKSVTEDFDTQREGGRKSSGKQGIVVSYDRKEERVIYGKLKQYLTKNSFSHIFEKSRPEIPSCIAFIMLISKNVSRQMKEEVQLAENHKRLIIPIFTETNFNVSHLDESLQYTLSHSPKIQWSQKNDDIPLKQLLTILLLHKSIEQKNLKLQLLAESYSQ